MAVTPADFRAHFPEFASVAAYPATQVEFWLEVAEGMISKYYWGTMRSLGVQLFAAHMLALESQASRAAAAGGIPGIASGPVSSKQVGPANISYDTTVAMAKDAGHWNLTTYGLRLWTMIDMFGALPIQVGVGYNPAGAFTDSAWLGPFPFPIPGTVTV